MEYAVRGPIAARATAMAESGRQTIPCNIGNPQALGQQPITYFRQVLSLLEYPALIQRERDLNQLNKTNSDAFGALANHQFAPDDVLDTCDTILTKMKTGLGAYTASNGPVFIRQAIADFIDNRDDIQNNDGLSSNPNNIYLTNGASVGVRSVIELLIADKNDGIMIPIPQYPLYSATIKRAGGVQVNYYPDEDSGWTLSKDILENAITDAKNNGTNVKAIVVINPANPTGSILSKQSALELADFAEKYGLAIIADEVYQENLYGGTFHSFASIVGNRSIPLFSLHSTSKGFCGECGRRGGYLEVRHAPEITNASAAFNEIMLKQASVNLCSNTIGQAMTYLMVNPPKPGAASYDLYTKERDGILQSLFDKATMIRDAFTKMDGVECFGETGAMYLFPRLNKLPAGTTDYDYCMSLLEATGLCTINGSGFGQKPGTNHLRIAFLPSRELLEEVLPKWIQFHNSYVNV